MRYHELIMVPNDRRALLACLCLLALVAAARAHTFELYPPGEESEDHDNLTVAEKWDRMEKRLKSVADSVLKFFSPQLMRIMHGVNLDPKCMVSLLKWARGIRKLEGWAISMIDASGKFPSGMFEGTMTALGSYDQCLAVKNKHFVGKFCRVHVRPYLPPKPKFVRGDVTPSELQNLTENSWLVRGNVEVAHYFYIVNFMLGFCVPSTCSERDVNETIKGLTKHLYLESWTSGCEILESKEFYTRDIVIISFFGALCALIAVATYVDVFHNDKPLEQNTQEKRPLPSASHSDEGLGKQILICFSAYSNVRRLLSTKTSSSDDAILCIYGLRLFSILWIILCHTYLYGNIQMLKGMRWAIGNREKLGFQIIGNGTVAVDTFFLISGILVAYVTVTLVDKKKTHFNVPVAILHRLWRLTPAYAMVLALTLLIRLFSYGPLFKEHTQFFVDTCEENWWANLLYVNNFQDSATRCLSHSWYLSADTQLYLVALIVLIVMFRWRKAGLWMAFFLIIFSIVSTGLATYLMELPPTMLIVHPDPESRLEIMNKIYILPHAHAGAYFVGFLLGYFLVYHKEVTIPKWAVALGWAISASTNLAVLLGVWQWNRGNLPDVPLGVFYASVHRTAWALGVAWVVFACQYGYGGWIARFLSWKALYTLSRLTFLVYLIHPMVQQLIHGNLRAPLQAIHHVAIYSFFGHVVFSYLFSFLLSLACESPFLALEKILMRRKMPPPPAAAGQLSKKPNEQGIEKVYSTTPGNEKILTNGYLYKVGDDKNGNIFTSL